MTLANYLKLDGTQQIQLLWTMGQVTDERIKHPYKFELFQLNDFYVELKYRSQELQGIIAFDYHSILLLPYIAEIEIPI